MSVRGRLTLVLLIGAMLALYWPAVQALWVIWLDVKTTTYTHGLLIAALSLWLLWRNDARAASSVAPQKRDGRGLFMVALCVLVLGWQLAFRAGIQLGYLLLLPPLIWCAVRVSLGAAAARRAAFPLGFLYFAMPLWDYLIPLAQQGTIHAVRFMLRVVGIPAYFSGDTVHIPSGVFAIEGGCSGLHFIVVALAIAALLGELRGDSWRMRVRWLVVTLLLAVLTNWIRVFTIIVLGHVTHMQHYIVSVSHYWYGWGLFLIAVFALFLYERRFPEREPATDPVGPGEPAGLRFAPAPVAMALAIAALPATLNPVIEARTASEVPRLARPLRIESAGWRYAPADEHAWRPSQVGADLEQRWRFASESKEVELYVAWYRDQKARKKLGGYSNRPRGEAELLEEQQVRESGHEYSAQRVTADGGEALLWIEYRVGDRAFASPTRAQLWYSWRTLATLSSLSSSVRALRSPCRPDCEAASSALSHFVSQGGGSL
jgi:EpsI family protein